MSIFDIGNVGDSGGSPVAPTQPTVDTTSLSALQAVSGLVSTGLQVSQQVAQDKSTAQASGAMAQHHLELSKIAESIKQGGRSSAAGETAMRATKNRFIASNPALTVDLEKQYARFVGTSGMGKVAIEGTEEEQLQERLQGAAEKDGYILPGMTQEERDLATIDHVNFTKAEQKMAQATKELALRSAKIGVAKGDIELATLQAREDAKEAASEGASASYGRLSSTIKGIMSDFKSGRIDQAKAVQRAEAAWIKEETSITIPGQQAGADYLKQITSPMKKMYDLSLRVINKEVSTEVAEAQAKNIAAVNKSKLWKNERLAPYLSLSQIAPNLSPIVVAQASAEIVNMAKTGELGGSVDPIGSDKEDFAGYLTWSKEGISSYNKGTSLNQDELGISIDNSINSMLKDIDAYSLKPSQLSDYKELVGFLADPEVGKFIKARGGINAEVSTKAAAVLGHQYRDKVIPILRDTYDAKMFAKAKADTPFIHGVGGAVSFEDISATDVIEPVFSGNGVTFRSTQPNPNFGLRSTVNELNGEVATRLNRLIRMGAHLNGHTNYKQVYDQNFVGIFGADQPGQEEASTPSNSPRGSL